MNYQTPVYIYQKVNGQAVLLMVLPFQSTLAVDDVETVVTLQTAIKKALREYKAHGNDYTNPIYYRLGNVNQEFAYLPDAN